MSRAEDLRESLLDPFTDLTPEEISRGNPSDVKFQVQLAGVLADALTFVRVTARNSDYFSGYTLAEILQDRIKEIGPDIGDTAYSKGEIFLNQTPFATQAADRLSLIVRNSTGLTKLEELVVLRERVTAAVDVLLTVEE